MDLKQLSSLVAVLVFHIVLHTGVAAPAVKADKTEGLVRRIRDQSDEKPTSAPEQIHIALGNDWSEMVILWSTHARSSSVVKYGLLPDSLDLTASGDCVEFSRVEGNSEGLQFIHRVKLKDWSPTLLVFGDMGYSGGAPSLRLLNEAATKRNADVVLHVGDFAYDLHDEGGKLFDRNLFHRWANSCAVPVATAGFRGGQQARESSATTLDHCFRSSANVLLKRKQ